MADKDRKAVTVTEMCPKGGRNNRKRFSHRRNYFPSRRLSVNHRLQQWLAEFHSEKVIAVRMSDSDDFGMQIPRVFADWSGCGKRGTGNFQGNLCWRPQRTVNRN